MKFYFDVYLYVVYMFGVELVCCVVVEDSILGLNVVWVVGMKMIVFVGVSYIFDNYVDVLCVMGIMWIMCWMDELLVFVEVGMCGEFGDV